MRKDYLAVEDN